MTARTLVEDLRELARARERHAVELAQALEEISGSDVSARLREVGEVLPLVIDADCATIWLCDEHGMLQLVAASGWGASDTRAHALQPLELRAALRVADSESITRLARTLGFRWAQVWWLGGRETPIGSLLLGSRTNRRPQPRQLVAVGDIAVTLSDSLMNVKDRAAQAQAFALELARSAEPHALEAPANDAVGDLRPRERAILELCADGLSTSQIAKLLVISEHTVRTHVKTALRTLGVHTRAEAAGLVRASEPGLLF
jgi:RNA polymerase sigma factor (sigma-70 family)